MEIWLAQNCMEWFSIRVESIQSSNAASSFPSSFSPYRFIIMWICERWVAHKNWNRVVVMARYLCVCVCHYSRLDKRCGEDEGDPALFLFFSEYANIIPYYFKHKYIYVYIYLGWGDGKCAEVFACYEELILATAKPAVRTKRLNGTSNSGIYSYGGNFNCVFTFYCGGEIFKDHQWLLRYCTCCSPPPDDSIQQSFLFRSNSIDIIEMNQIIRTTRKCPVCWK